MKEFKKVMGYVLMLTPMAITAYVIIAAIWKIVLIGVLFLAMASYGAHMIRESNM